MSQFEPRPLHLHTLDSLCADLVSGRPVSVGQDGRIFVLSDERARSALQWYRNAGATNWSANVGGPIAEGLVDSILLSPPTVAALPARSANAANRRLTLRKLEAHRFAGLHIFGSFHQPPPNYVFEFASPITLFEGANGSGKTSLINAIVWVLTGEILRPQRAPEKALEEFECWISAADGSAERTAHRLTPVTPLPDRDAFSLDRKWVPIDTWVELTFEDEEGRLLPPIRRSQTRSKQGKVIETPPDLAVLQIDPIATRIGTVMPGLLPNIKVGSESELGRAVSELTGLSALTDLADHVRRAKYKIEKEFIKAKTRDIELVDESYERARSDVISEVAAHPGIAPVEAMPPPSEDATIEATLAKIFSHFEERKALALSGARSVLGEKFDAGAPAQRADLEKSVAPALTEVRQLSRLTSMARLTGFRKLTIEQLANAGSKLDSILEAAKTLNSLAENPTLAARTRLYARVAMWMADHPDAERSENECVVCGSPIDNVVDPITGEPVKKHIHDVQANALLVSQTLSFWAQAALGDLARTLPETLRSELNADLPEHPCNLIRVAVVDELFATVPFGGVLAALKEKTAETFDELAANSSILTPAMKIDLPRECVDLQIAARRLDKALRFARWRQANDDFAKQLYERIVGPLPKSDQVALPDSLVARLVSLEETVKGAEPISRAIAACRRLKADLAKRRDAQKRLGQYETASGALGNLLPLAELTDLQVEQLRLKLRSEASKWRKRVYLGAFPGTAHELVDASMSRRGELDLVVATGSVSAPAQHVTNASALRASLVGFFLAFWEHVLGERGGLRLLLLDDPQELLDDENQERLASALATLVAGGGQVVVTTNDPRFATYVAKIPGKATAHHWVSPATKKQPLVRTPLSVAEVFRRKAVFEMDIDAEEPARAFAEACRVFLEATMGDLFDDPASSGWGAENPTPSLSAYVGRLRNLIRNSPLGMFGGGAFRKFAAHPALADGASTLKLLNKPHHQDRRSITPGEVAECANELSELVEMADRLHDECRRWRRREQDETPKAAFAVVSKLPRLIFSNVDVNVCPDLAAFTQHHPVEESQGPTESLDVNLFLSKSLFYLRRDNFGFAAPKGAIAIVESEPLPVADRRLVIARHGDEVYARRFLRSEGSMIVGLTAETPDPRESPKTKFLPESELVLHQVVGVIFEHNLSIGPGRAEAVLVDAPETLKRAEIAYRIRESSAVPLALPKQIVLGGPLIELDQLGQHNNALVALSLADGSQIFKRVGAKLSGALAHLRQFESIGGLGASEILSVGKPQAGVLEISRARLIIGVLYSG